MEWAAADRRRWEPLAFCWRSVTAGGYVNVLPTTRQIRSVIDRPTFLSRAAGISGHPAWWRFHFPIYLGKRAQPRRARPRRFHSVRRNQRDPQRHRHLDFPRHDRNRLLVVLVAGLLHHLAHRAGMIATEGLRHRGLHAGVV